MVKKLLAIALVAWPAVVMPADRPLWTLASMRAAAPAALGDALLPAGHPPIVRADILLEASQVALYAQPVRLDRAFCRAGLFRVAVRPLEYATDPLPDGPRYRSGAVETRAVYRSSTAPAPCELDTRGYFPISGGSDADGRALVRTLIAIKAAAGAGGRIPTTTCIDRSPAKNCASGARALLAGIKTDAIGNVALTPCADAKIAAAKSCGPQIWLGASGGEAAYWIASFTIRGTGRTMSVARISLVRERVAK